MAPGEALSGDCPWVALPGGEVPVGLPRQAGRRNHWKQEREEERGLWELGTQAPGAHTALTAASPGTGALGFQGLPVRVACALRVSWAACVCVDIHAIVSVCACTRYTCVYMLSSRGQVGQEGRGLCKFSPPPL